MTWASFLSGALFVGSMLFFSMLFLYGDKLAIVTDEILSHLATRQPIDDDEGSTTTEKCSEPSCDSDSS